MSRKKSFLNLVSRSASALRHGNIKKFIQTAFPLAIAAFFLSAGAMLIWASTLQVPSFEAFAARKVLQSTKIYDRTGQVVLYDTNPDVKRKVVPLSEVSPLIQKAAIAIEDANFYNHNGIEPKAIARAVLVNLHLKEGYLGQGGSTITQQVIKNVLLTKEKTLARKVKEWFLSMKLERELTKDQILELYFNETPYGGPVYGIEEASLRYFGKKAKDVTLPEAAYLAALPQAPTYYSPYGNHKKELDARKNLVLARMAQLGFITEEEAEGAQKTEVVFAQPSNSSIKAAHFAFYVHDWLVDKYGKDAVETGGYRVITTLDWELQKRAEAIVAQYGAENERKFNAKNAGMVGIDPKTGQILVMVGSRDYFDVENEGSFNVTTAHRQPGSSFKPFVYATAFKKGYTPETVLFDVRTQFSTACTADGRPIGGATEKDCYTPVNYDGVYHGPMTIRNALAQSINIPAIKALYLVGTKAALETARSFGITSLTDPARYGLTLVLGGGEVSPLELTGAYSVFANDGVRNPITPILRIEEPLGGVIEEFKETPERVIDENVARQISDILTDNAARTPGFGANSLLYIPERDVAVKTGTTNDYKDAWIMGYTPNIALGAWVGNNDNTPMEKKVAGFIVAPMWNAMMRETFSFFPAESFPEPDPIPSDIKPILRGVWQAGGSQDGIHSILYWVNKNDPRGPAPAHPENDPQFALWEPPVRAWAGANGGLIQSSNASSTPAVGGSGIGSTPNITITSPVSGPAYKKTDRLTISFVRTSGPAGSSEYPISLALFYLNGIYIGSTNNAPFQYSFVPADITGAKSLNELKVVVHDATGTKGEATVPLILE